MKSRIHLTKQTLIATTLVGMLACGRPSTLPSPEIPSPAPSSTPSQPAPERNSSKSWQLLPTTDAQHYSTIVATNVQQTAGFSDTIITKAQYTLSITRSATSTSLAGSIDTFTVQAGNRIGEDTPVNSFPVSFTGEIQNHDFKLDISKPSRSPSSSLPCNVSARSALPIVQRNVFTLPLQLRANMSWQDSISSTSCNGQLLLNLTILRTYKVIGESSFNGISVIAVDMTEKTLSTGEGSQDQHRIVINGEALKSASIYIDPANGSLINLSAETHTTLQIQSSGRTQQFIQSSKETTTRM